MRNRQILSCHRIASISMRYVFTALIVIMVSSLFAGNSVFSYDGTPCQNYGNDSYGMTMGDVGISDVFRQNTGYGNPAILGSATQTLFSTGLMMGWTKYTSRDVSRAVSERNFKDNSLDFPFFSMAFPIQNHRLGFQFNSVASGVLQSQTTFVVDSTDVVETQSIDRYIYRADLMYAYHYKWLNVGAGLNYYFGHDIRRLYQNGGYGIFNTSEKLEQNYKNPSFGIGFTAELGDVSVGAVFNSATTLKGSLIRSSIHETEDLGGVEYPIANHIGAGVTSKFLDEYKVSADLHYEMWESTNSTENTRNTLKAGIGFAQEPGVDTRKTFFGKMPKRVGFSYRNLPFEVNGKAVYETAVSGGVSLPVKDSNNRLDFGLQYFVRGNLDDHNLQDNGLMLMFGITGFDILTRDYKRTAPREIPEAEEIAE